MSKIVFFGNKELYNKIFKILSKGMSSVYLEDLEDIKKINLDLLIYSLKTDSEFKNFTPEYRAYLNLTRVPIVYIFDRKISEFFNFKNDLDDYMIKPFYIEDIITRIQIRLNVKNLQTRLRNLIQEQITILDLSSIFTSHYNYQTRLKTVIVKLSKIFKAEDISMILIDNDKKAEVVTDLDSNPKNFKNILLDLNKYPEIKEAILIRKPLYIKNVQEHKSLSPYIEKIKKKGIKSILILPIIYHNNVLGVISIKFKKMRSDTYNHLLKYSMIVTNTTAIALKNAQILDKVSKEMEVKTSFKIKRQEMAKSLKHYSHFINKASIPMMLANIEGNIHFINTHIENILEYDRYKILTLNLYSMFKEDKRVSLKKQLSLLSEENYHMEFEDDIKLPHSKKRRLRFDITRFQKNIFLIQLDDQIEIDRKKDKKINALNNVINFYENLIDISTDAYIGVNKAGDIILFNKGAEQILGYSNSEIKNIKIWNLYPSLEYAKETSKNLFLNNGKIMDYKTELKSKFNNIIHVNLNAFLIYDNDKNHIGSIGIFKIN